MDYEDLGISNKSGNEHLVEVVDRGISRRSFLSWGSGALSLSVFAPLVQGCSSDSETMPRLGFSTVPVSISDTVTLPPEYQYQVVYAWGDPINGTAPVFKQDGSNTAAEQALQSGMHHDGGHFFSLPDWKSNSSTSGLWAVNHEYVDAGLLVGPPATWSSLEGVAKSKAAHGVSVVQMDKQPDGKWKVVASNNARRITADTEMDINGPAKGHALMKTSLDPLGEKVRGTVNNCAAGFTPWGTYLTCEENFNGVFGTDDPTWTANTLQLRYGLSRQGFANSVSPLYPWWKQDNRFDLSKEPNEPNRFGYVVEIDPYTASKRPVKRTALGRFKHENCEWMLTKDGRIAVYMGCDEVNEYVYKFVSTGKVDMVDRAKNVDLLDSGTLYVAKFNDDGTGIWLELSPGKNGLTPENGWNTLGDICVRTRQAADRAGATMMDRPEWVAVNRITGDVYVTLTNNSRRGTSPASVNNIDGTSTAASARPAVNAANPTGGASGNPYGHIVKWKDAGGDAAATTFSWSIFLKAGDKLQSDTLKKGTINGDDFGSPDGLWIDDAGYMWIQTDVSTSRIMAADLSRTNADYKNLGNNQMLIADPATGVVKRFLVGPNQCEITGAHMTPDRKTMFINIQHPGEDGSDADISATPKKYSSWPDGAAGGRPRSATIAITRKDGGEIGT